MYARKHIDTISHPGKGANETYSASPWCDKVLDSLYVFSHRTSNGRPIEA